MVSSVHSFDETRSVSAVRTPSKPTAPNTTVSLNNGPKEWVSPRHIRRLSNASTLSSVGGFLDSTPFTRADPVTEIGHNAISTLLQAPIVRTGLSTLSTLSTHSASGSSATFRTPTARDIPLVTLTGAPHVDNVVFKDYLTKVTPLFEALQRSKANDADKKARVEAESAVSTGHLLSPEDAISPSADWTVRHGQNGRRRSSRGSLRGGPPSTTPLSTIPKIYLESNFQLENPRTFDIVTERSELISRTTTLKPDESDDGNFQDERKALATNAILQEKLSWYIETVESHLTASVSVASTSFFAALDSLKTLQKEAEESVALLRRLRAQLAELDREMAMGGMQILELKRRKANIQKLGDSVDQLGSVITGFAHCRDLVETQRYDHALDRIEVLERFMAGSSPRTTDNDCTWLTSKPTQRIHDLRGLHALSKIPSEMAQMKTAVAQAFESRFLRVLLEDLRRHAASVPPSDTLQRWNLSFQRSRGPNSARVTSGVPAYVVTSPAFSTEISTCLQTLSRAGLSTQAAEAFKEAVMKEMKGVIRLNLPSSSDDDAASVASFSTRRSGTVTRQEKSVNLSRNLAAMDPSAGEEMIIRMYASVGEVLRRLGVQIKVILDVTTGICLPPAQAQPRTAANSRVHSPVRTRQRSNSATLRDELGLILDISALIGNAVDVAIYYVARVLRTRNEPTVHLPLDYFLRYVAVNRLFVNECEAISGRPGEGISSVVDGQIKEFVRTWAFTQKSELQAVLDTDRWVAVEVGPDERDVVDRLVRCDQDDVAELWVDTGKLGSELSAGHGTIVSVEKEAVEDPDAAQNKTKQVFIGERKFILVESSVKALHTLEQFCMLMTNIPVLTMEVCMHLVDYLKLFNSRSCQLILGAGATRSAGLVNINTRHLALAFLSLSFLVALMERIMVLARRRLPPSSPLFQEVERVKQAFGDHQVNIEEKLIDIMSSRSSVHVSTMLNTVFDSAEVIGEDTSMYMETLTKETAKLHRVLIRHLDSESVGKVMSDVFARYEDDWGSAFEAAVSRVQTKEGWARLRRDAELFEWRIGKIEQSAGLGACVMQIVDSGRVGGVDGGEVEGGDGGVSEDAVAVADEGPIVNTSTPTAATDSVVEDTPVTRSAAVAEAEADVEADQTQQQTPDTSLMFDQEQEEAEEKAEAMESAGGGGGGGDGDSTSGSKSASGASTSRSASASPTETGATTPTSISPTMAGAESSSGRA